MDNEVLRIENVSKTFEIDNGTVRVLDGIDLVIEHGEFVCVVGTSGCGKSTLLRIISGLERASAGGVRIGERMITVPSVAVGMIFQESRLFPWLTVEDNIAFGVHGGMGRKEKRDIISSHIELVGLTGFANAFPKQLSGGMQQRVSIARALINRPGILLLDEPFGALDALTKINMQNEIMRIWEAERTTMIMVTHDIDEAIYLGDRVIVLSERPGRIKRQLDITTSRPRDRSGPDFVNWKREIFADFFGETGKPIEYYL
jgi:sulfonate transport system ATP-binding protein